MEKQVNKHRREPDFDVGDSVWVTTKNWKTERPSCKLDYQMAGLYRILEKVGHSYRLDLPQSIRVHPVFSPDKLQKASNDPLPGQRNKSPLPIQVDGNDEWEVEEILARIRSRRKAPDEGLVNRIAAAVIDASHAGWNRAFWYGIDPDRGGANRYDKPAPGTAEPDILARPTGAAEPWR